MSINEAGPDARRLHKPGWKDPRLLIGVLLVVASIAGVVALVSSLDKTVPMYVARDDISLGQRIEPSRLSVVDVRLEGLQGRYLSADAAPETGLQANSLIRAGELVPVAAVGLPDALHRKPVSIEVSEQLPEAVLAGTRVDVWAAARGTNATSYEKPAMLLEAAEVSAVREMDSGFGGSGGMVIEVLVEDQALPGLLAAIANEARITVVYNPGGGAK